MCGTQQDERTLQQLAAEAIAVQDACYLDTVSDRFAKAMLRLKKLENLDTQELREHAITVMWVSRIASLTNHNDLFSMACSAVKKLAANVSSADLEVICSLERKYWGSGVMFCCKDEDEYGRMWNFSVRIGDTPTRYFHQVGEDGLAGYLRVIFPDVA
jgi:hypothetical protein